jgi:hypothetical protein
MGREATTQRGQAAIAYCSTGVVGIGEGNVKNDQKSTYKSSMALTVNNLESEVWLMLVPMVAWGGLVTPIVPVAVTCADAWDISGDLDRGHRWMMIAEARLTEPAKRAAERKRFNILKDIVVVVVVKKERRG